MLNSNVNNTWFLKTILITASFKCIVNFDYFKVSQDINIKQLLLKFGEILPTSNMNLSSP